MAVIETMTFRLRPGTGEEEFLLADRRVQTEFVPNHPGFLRRTTARGEDGQWVVISLWASEADAEASAARGVDHPVVAEFMAAVEPTSVTTRRYSSLD
jgi:heme-degrading monooxygenase HmoA